MNEISLTQKKYNYKKGKFQIEAIETEDKINITVYDWNEVNVPLIKSRTIRGTLDTIDVTKEIEDILKEIEEGEQNEDRL